MSARIVPVQSNGVRGYVILIVGCSNHYGVGPREKAGMIDFDVEISGIYKPCTIARADTKKLWCTPVQCIGSGLDAAGCRHIPEYVHPSLRDAILPKGLVVAIPNIENG